MLDLGANLPSPMEDAGGAAAGDAPPALPVPTLWLLGRTGAGKSSLMRALAGAASLTGAGFAPCTRTATLQDLPADKPVLRFLDTRGLDEAGYDPAEDLAAAERGSHAALVLARLDDPVQGMVAQALADVRARRPKLPMIVVHTGADLLPDEASRERARSRVQAMFEKAARGPLPHVTLALPETGPAEGLDALALCLADLLPAVALLLLGQERRAADAQAFAALRPLVLWYAGAAAASDALPLVGTVGVPGLQGAMLHGIARRLGVAWTSRRATAFAAALGTGVMLRLGAGMMLRQAGRLVPVAGPTLGAAASASVSFATTYALGRVAVRFLSPVTEKGGDATTAPPSHDELRALYRDAFAQAHRAHR